MSSVTKGISKVFKPIAKIAKKVVPIALVAGAVLFTAGAALGVPAAAGGWGAAVSSVTGSIGGTMGSIVTGAVTQAGYGAAIGAGVAAVTGGDIAKGALLGAAGGAVTGGISGAAGLPIDPLAPAEAATATPQQLAASGPGGGMGSVTGLNTASTGAGVGAAGLGATAAPAATAAAPGLLGPGGWVERNGTLVGQTASGIGTGLLAGMRAEDGVGTAEAHRGARYASNYSLTGTGGGLLPRAAAGQLRSAHPNNPTMAEKYDQAAGGHVEFRYNPQTNSIDRVMVA